MLLVKSFFFETNKQISAGLAASIFVHLAVVSVFLVGKTVTKEIDADLLRAQAIPVQIVLPIESPVIQKTKSQTPAVKKQQPVQKTTSNPDKILTEKPIEKTVDNSAEAPTHNLDTEKIPVVKGASLVGRRIQPEYPKRALRLKQEGTVFLHVLVSETGKRQDIKLSQPSQYALLNQAAIKAVKKWTFDPNIVNGRAVQSWVEIPIEFKIQ